MSNETAKKSLKSKRQLVVQLCPFDGFVFEIYKNLNNRKIVLTLKKPKYIRYKRFKFNI